MNFQEIQDSVKGHLNEKDPIVIAQIPFFINSARLALQRQRDWNFTRKTATGTYPSTAGVGYALPTDFKCFFSDKAVAISEDDVFVPIEGSGEKSEDARNFRRGGDDSSGSTDHRKYYRYQEDLDNYLMIVPEPLEASIKVKYFKWLPDLSNNGDETWLERYAYDLVIYEALVRAYTFLADDGKTKTMLALASGALAQAIIHDNAVEVEGGINL